MNLREAKKLVGALSAQQLAKLNDWINDLLKGSETNGSGRGAKGRPHRPQKTYQQEMVRCGKKGCRCAEGQLHGPYWYAYWSEGGRVRSQYVGKRLPRGVKPSSSAKTRGVR